MMPRSLVGLVLLLLSSVIVSSSVPDPHVATLVPRGTLVVGAATQTPAVRNFTIYVGINGFNSTYRTGLRLTVNQSDIVTIRFVYNDTTYPTNNPHEVCIDVYELCSQTIDRNTPERILTFTANIVGQLTFKCVVNDCTAHRNLLAGLLEVRPYAGVAWVRTDVHLSGEVRNHSPREIVLSAHLVDVNNSVVEGALVRFYRNSTWGFAPLGDATTNSTGLAVLTYSPPAGGNITFSATFDSSGVYLSSSSDPVTMDYHAPLDSQTGFPFVWGQNPTVDFRAVGVPSLSGLVWFGIVFLVIGSVWTTYLYAGTQLLGIWKDTKKITAETSPESTRELAELSKPEALVRQVSPLTAVLAGLGLAGLGYIEFLSLSLIAPTFALLFLPPVALVETFVVARLLSQFQ